MSDMYRFHGLQPSIHGIFEVRVLEWGAIAFSDTLGIEVYKKDIHDPDNHYGVITHLETDILECKVKWALGSITINKAMEVMEFQLTCFITFIFTFMHGRRKWQPTPVILQGRGTWWAALYGVA